MDAHVISISASPTACPARMQRCAGTRSDRLNETLPMVCSVCPTDGCVPCGAGIGGCDVKKGKKWILNFWVESQPPFDYDDEGRPEL